MSDPDSPERNDEIKNKLVQVCEENRSLKEKIFELDTIIEEKDRQLLPVSESDRVSSLFRSIENIKESPR
jgi:cell division septum initiation protein DivIVA